MRGTFKDRIATHYIALNVHQCTACWKCVESCPQDVIGKVNFFFHKHAVIQNSDACIGCMKCFKVCESQAILKVNNVREKQKTSV